MIFGAFKLQKNKKGTLSIYVAKDVTINLKKGMYLPVKTYEDYLGNLVKKGVISAEQAEEEFDKFKDSTLYVADIPT